MSKLQCDVCDGVVNFDKGERVWHFSGYINEVESDHIHVCEKCQDKYSFSKISVFSDSYKQSLKQK